MITDRQPLAAAFAARFQSAPTGVAFAPGRINLIGDHTDYNGLPVLPMALDRGVRVGFRAIPVAEVALENRNPLFPPTAFRLEPRIGMERQGHWSNYPRAAATALVTNASITRGIQGMVESNLPVASGLSSSSALLVATALALLEANGRVPESTALMSWLAEAERLVGTEGGGMDQAVILGGQAGHAIRIDFSPWLLLRPVPIPASWRIVVASSMVEAAKAGLAREGYNTRVAECREALHTLGAEGFPELMDDEERGLSRAEAGLSGNLFRRVRHVLTEGRRVEEATTALENGDAASMGRLLTASHASLRDDYQVSCPELDELVGVAEAAGAVGARLTGAGFGGCVVALAEEHSVDGVMDRIWEGYHVPRGIPESDRSTVLFAAVPGGAAKVTPLD